ncbi:hypothetical protein MTR67_039711, partial [Solanum verrucosum]
GYSCTFILGGSIRGPFTYVFSYESFVSGYWGSHFRTNARYAYWTLRINEQNHRARSIVPEFICESRSIKESFTITDSNPLSNPTQRNIEVLMEERANLVFHNKAIDGTAMKRHISRLTEHFGMAYTSHILDQVKTLGFQQATTTSISLGIDDLLTIPSKGWLVQDAEQQSLILEKHHHYGNVHAVEKLRQSIEIWYATNEYLR